MFFMDSILSAYGFNITGLNQTANDPEVMENAVSFQIRPESSLRVRTKDGLFVRFEGGDVRHKGGFDVHYGLATISEQNFRVRPNGPGTANGGAMFSGANPQNPFRMELRDPVVHFNPYTSELAVGCADLTISKDFARQVGRPELSGLLVGVVTIMAHVELESASGTDRDWRDPMPAGIIDLGLLAMGSLTSAGRIGTFPTGRSGLSMSTTSCNRGTADIPWNAPMNEHHPVICMNLYRVLNGRFEQIGQSWLKHGFLATNSSDVSCGTCVNPGTGTLLGPGCTDTYGTGNNSDRRYLGPREEKNPLTGHWTCAASWFANFLNDCIRRNTGTGLDAVAHRLEVDDSDLNVSGAELYYEAFYINENETNKYNQIGYRKATAAWTGTTWTFTTTTNIALGPAISAWGDARSTATPRTEGDAIVAVKTTPISGGTHYEYAVYLLDLDRQVREFSLPIESGLNVTNIGFRDVDKDPTNNWTSAYADGTIKWSTETFAANPNANSLKYGRVFNFWFDVNAAPVASTSTLNLFKPGALTDLTASISGPPPPAPAPISGTIALGDFEGPAANPTATIELRPTAGGASAFFSGVTIAVDGSFSFNTTLRGSYDVYVKSSHWLRKKLAGSISIGAAGVSGLSFGLVNGDVNGDNVVDIGDYSGLSGAFGSQPGDGTWNANADLNGDLSVDIGDFAILSANFGQAGD
jgi:hypothetical protein